MMIGAMVITFHVPWVKSLKEKRAIVKSICAKVSNKFNVAIAEIDQQDTHHKIVLGLSCIANEVSQVDRMLDQMINYIEGNTEAEIIELEREII